MKACFIMIGIGLMIGSALFAQTATPPAAGDGSAGNPYRIATLENLYWISQNSGEWGKCYLQTASIDASASSGWDGGSGWTPIGNGTPAFSGVYNGQGYSVSGLTINRSSTSILGLFGDTDDATIQNLGVTSVNITGNNYLGALAGYTYGGTVSGCHSSGSVSASGTGSSVGGLAGSFYGTMSNCYSSASASGYAEIGGLLGKNYYGTVSNCHSNGSVSGSGTAGGLVGYNSGNSAAVRNCYSRGSVTRSSGSFSDLGGFAGNNDASCIIEYCYSTGFVSCGGATNKGFVGSNSGTCSANFFDSQTSGQTSGTGATDKTTAQMKIHTTFTGAGWDFEAETANGSNDYWDMDYSGTINNGYPFLSWENGGDVSLPVGLASFSGRCEGRSIVLAWVTESEVDNLGYILERSEDGEAWCTVASYETHEALEGRGNASDRAEYEFTDQNVESGRDYHYRISDVNTRGVITAHAPLTVRLDALPEGTMMDNAYPNPFNPRTFIAYRLAEDTDVNITVFDLLGRSVKELYSGRQPAGSYQVYWNGTGEGGFKVSSEPYVIRMRTESGMQVQKVMLLK